MFIYVFQNHVNTLVGFLILCACMVTYGLYSIAATKYQKRKLKKNPPINEDMIKTLMLQMGRKPSEAQVKAAMKAMNQHK